jgi:YVTN family beta-propeller protein
MKTRGIILLALTGIVGVAGVVLAPQLRTMTRQDVYIRVHDSLKSMGLGIRSRDLAHMRKMSGLQDISNVSCLDCHGSGTNQLAWARPRRHHPAPEGMAVDAQGRRLYVALGDTDEVAEIDTTTRRVLRRVRIQGRPTGLALGCGGRCLFVTCRELDTVIALGTDTMAERARTYVGLGPVGLVSCLTSVGERVFVANTGSDDVSVLDAVSLKEIVRLPAGREPYAVTASADGARVFVANRLAAIPKPDAASAAEFTIVDAARGRVLRRLDLESAHLSEGVAAVPGRSWALAPLVRVRNLVPITQVANGWVMSSGMAVVETNGTRVVQLPLDEANAYFADPSGIAVDPAGRFAYVASGGGDAITVLDLDRVARWLDRTDAPTRAAAIHDLSLSPEYVVARIPTGRNPRQVALSPDGSTLYVAEQLEDRILIVETRTRRALGHIVLGDGGMNDPVRRGQRAFTTAAKTFQRQFSCRSCHPDGGVDGLAYDFDGDGIGDNLLDNRSLQGVGGTWPFKWSGKNPSLSVQCGPRFAKVLMRTDPFADRELEDLTAFVESMPPARAVHASRRGQPLTPAQERGQQIFFATLTTAGKEIPPERQCATCHRPPLYANRQKTAVGTKAPTDSSEFFDTPHLLGIAASAPYLHDGRAKSLEELWTVYQTNDLHGVTSYMNKHQLNDLIEFLKTL